MLAIYTNHPSLLSKENHLSPFGWFVVQLCELSLYKPKNIKNTLENVLRTPMSQPGYLDLASTQ